MSLISNPDYLEAVTYTAVFSDPGRGLIKATEEIKSNQNQTRQLNTIIALLTSLHQKVDRLEARVRSLEGAKAPEINKSLDELTAQITNLKIGDSGPAPKGPKVANRVYFYDNPKEIFKQEKSLIPAKFRRKCEKSFIGSCLSKNYLRQYVTSFYFTRERFFEWISNDQLQTKVTP